MVLPLNDNPSGLSAGSEPVSWDGRIDSLHGQLGTNIESNEGQTPQFTTKREANTTDGLANRTDGLANTTNGLVLPVITLQMTDRDSSMTSLTGLPVKTPKEQNLTMA
eukprot:UN01232